jgi:hypothetical protein
LRQAEREAEIDKIAELEEALVTVHEENFRSPQHPKAPAPATVDPKSIRKRLEQEAGIDRLITELGGGQAPPQAAPAPPVDRTALIRAGRKQATERIPIYKRGERRHAEEAAERAAAEEADAEEQRRRKIQTAEQRRLDGLWAELEKARVEVENRLATTIEAERRASEEAHSKKQAELDTTWQKLLGNDPETTIEVLEAAFSDNEAPAAPLNCHEDRVTVAMRFSAPEAVVPERKPDWTPGGKRTLKKRTKTERNDLYLEALGSNILATVKEALAVAPGTKVVEMLVVREETDKKNAGKLAAIYAGEFHRAALEARGWGKIGDPARELMSAPSALVNLKGKTEEVAPIDLGEEPELLQVLEQMARDLELEPVTPPKRRQPRRPQPEETANEAAPELDVGEATPPVESDRELPGGLTAEPSGMTRDEPTAPEIEQLQQKLRDPQAEVRMETLLTLSDAGGPDVLRAMLQGASDPDPDVRWAGMHALRDFGGVAAREAFERGLTDSDPSVRREAATGLADFEDPRTGPRFAELANDSDPDMRWLAVMTLGRLNSERHVSTFLRAIGDADAGVRQAAASAMGDLREERVAAALIKALETDPDNDVRFSAAAGLVNRDSAQVRSALQSALQDADPGVREMAQMGLDG